MESTEIVLRPAPLPTAKQWRALCGGIGPWLIFSGAAMPINFFAKLGDAIVTGPTGNNLRDLRILLME